MEKGKIKLVGLLLAIACVFCCAGVGIAVLQPKSGNVVAKAATTDELTAEFTNNGQFKIEQGTKNTNMPTILEGSAVTDVTLPEGYQGAVLQAYRSSGADGWDAVRLNFTDSKIKIEDVRSIIVRARVENFNSETDEVRVIGANGTTRQYGVGKYDLSTWCDVTLTSESLADMTDENGYLSATEFTIRDKTAASHLYIDSITVIKAEYTTYEFTGLTFSTWDATRNFIYLNPVGADWERPQDGGDGWSATFLYNGGVGVMLGETKIAGSNIKFPGSMFINLGRAPSEGELLKVGGTFYNNEFAVHYVIPETTFTWDGAAWVEYVEEPEIEYTTYTVTKIGGATSSNANTVYVYSLEGDELPKDKGDWDNVYAYRADASVKLNDTEITATIKMPGDLYVPLGKDAEEGDIFTINGTFYNETTAIKLVFDNCKLMFDGEKWVEYVEEPVVEYTTYELGTLAVHINSTGETVNKPNETQLYMKRADGQALPYAPATWDHVFALESGDGWKLNGNSVTVGDLVSTNAGLFVAVGAANVQVGDMLTVSGTFTYAGASAKYVITESKFVWNGVAWEDYVEYTTYEVGSLVFMNWTADNNCIYLGRADGQKFAIPEDSNGGWTATFLYKDGVGVTLNGETIKIAGNIKYPNAMFINIGVAPNVDDVLTVGGTFYNTSLAMQYKVTETSFKWDGATWVLQDGETPDVGPDFSEYTTATVTKIGCTTSSSANVLNIYSLEGDELPKEKGDWDNVYSYGADASVKLNDTEITAEIKLPNDLYVRISEDVKVGDIFTINGMFYNEAKAVKLVFENCKLYWNGTAWQTEAYVEPPVVEYTTYELGTLAVHKHSTGETTNTPSATALYMASSVTLPFTTWGDKFDLESGDGFKLNGNAVTTGQLVSADKLLYVSLANANVQKGDVLSVSGTFMHTSQPAKYVIEESKFVWNGVAWEDCVEYTTYEVGSLVFMTWTAGNNFIYLGRADGQKFAIPEDSNGGWTASFLYKDGVGVTLNGKTIKIAGNIKYPNAMFISIGVAPNVDDVLTIGGTFYNTSLEIQYKVTETSFKWDGATWVLQDGETPDVGPDFSEYASYTVTKIGGYNAKNAIQLYSLEGDELPKTEYGNWDDVYALVKGASVKINGVALSGAGIKFPGDLYIPVDVELNEGDIFTINGTFYNEVKKVKFVFENCQMQMNAEGMWVAYEGTDTTEWQTFDLGKLVVHPHSSGSTSNVPKATALYIKSTTITNYPVNSWNAYFVLESGDGWKLNGNAVTTGQLISADNHLYVNLANVNVQIGDVLSVSGTFTYEAGKTKYVIEESTFVWNGTIWESYIEYETYELGSLKFAKWTEGNNFLYLHKMDGQAITPPSDGNDGWTATLKWKDGVGITLNDTQLDMNNRVKMPHEFFIALPMAPEVGDVLKVGGTFYNDEFACAYIVEESVFQWDGTTWIPVLEYTDYEVDGLTVSGSQTSVTYVDLEQASGEKFAVDGSYKFLGGSGVGVALNGERIETNSIIVSGYKLMISLDTEAEEGTVLTIGGTFYNVEAVVQYIISECSFIYEEGAWKVYESIYNEIGLGEVKILTDASMKQVIYFVSKDESVVIPDVWDYEFTCIFGNGITLNGQTVDAIIYSGDNALIVELSMVVNEGDELIIGGKFVCDEEGVLYFVKESKFTWNGEIWEGIIKYNTVELGKLTLFGNSATTLGQANKLHLRPGTAIESAEFELTLESGIGFTVNGETREATFKNYVGSYLYVTFDGVENGDVVTIGGTFYNKEYAIKYVIKETSFIWNDAWSMKYETVNVGPLSIVSISSTAQDLYLIPSNVSVTLPVADWEQGSFRLSSGNGITVNGQQIDMNNNWKSVGGNTMFVRLTSNIEGVAEGSIVVIEGTFRCDLYGYEYIFEETSFIYENGSWVNLLDTVKVETVVELESYFATFSKGDYYETEWTLMQKIVSDAKAEINGAISKSRVETVLNEAKAAMDEIATKADVDANFPQWKESAKTELETYKDVSLYREAEKAIIEATVAQAKTDIDAATSWTDFNKTVTDAKATMDALWTDAQWTAAEEVVTAAKDELASYKAESDYYANEWATIQSIIAKANADIDAAIGNTTAIADIVANAKSKIDAVKTSVQVEEEEMVVLAAKAELEGYKTQSDYNEPEWNEIQTILANAYAKLDEAIGDDEAIAKVIDDAKAEMDKVLKSEEANAKAFEDAKYNAKEEIRNYANAINYDLYSEDSAAQISAYISEALEAIENITTIEGFAPVVATMKNNVESVKKLAGADGNQNNSQGCGSAIDVMTGLPIGVMLAAMVAVVIALRKKKEND